VAPLFATGFHIFYTPYHIMTSLITEIKHVVKKQKKILHPGGSRLLSSRHYISLGSGGPLSLPPIGGEELEHVADFYPDSRYRKKADVEH
jgi:hypothetical protein